MEFRTPVMLYDAASGSGVALGHRGHRLWYREGEGGGDAVRCDLETRRV